MAGREIKFKDSNDLGFDSGLEIPEFGFGKGTISKDRHPVISNGKEFGSGMISGIWSAGTSESFIKKILKSALPEGYGQAIDLSDMAGQNLKKLYDSSSREVKPLLNDMKRATARLLPATDKVLPNALQSRLKAWSDSYEGNTTGLSPEQARESSMNSTLGEVFTYQLETQAKERAQDQARNNVKEQIDAQRASMQLGQLGDIKLSLQRLVDYQDKITINYQRRSLELQYRQYFVAMDALAHQRETSHTTRMLLEGIQKNTGLPEIRKIQGAGDYADLLRNKFFNGMGSMLFGNRSAFMQQITGNIQQALSDNLRDFAGNARMGIGGFESAADMSEMMEGLGQTKAGMAGDLVGGAVANSVGGRLGRHANNWLKTRPKTNLINRGGRFLSNKLSNLPQKATEFAHSDAGDSLPMGMGYAVQFLKDVIHRSNATQTGLQRDDLKTLQEPSFFSGMARKSLTEIIPGYLARIYRELQVMRTGDHKTDLTVFDPSSGRFKSAGATAAGLKDMLFNKSAVKYNQGSQKAMVAELEKGSGRKMTPELQKDALKHLMHLTMNNRMGKPENLTDANAYMGSGVKDPRALAEFFQKYFGDKPSEEHQGKFQELMNALTHGMTDNRGHVQGLVNLGYGEMLEQMGMFTKQGNYNLDRFADAYSGGEFNPVAQHAEPGLAGWMTRRASAPEKTTHIHATPPAAPIKMTRAQQAEHNRQERKAKDQAKTAIRRAREVSPVKALMPPPDHRMTLSRELHRTSQDAIIHAIEASSTKKTSESMLEQLQAIRKHLDDGLSMHHLHSRLGMSLEQLHSHLGAIGHDAVGRAKGFLDRSVKDHLKSGWEMGTGAVGWLAGRPMAMGRGIAGAWRGTRGTRAAIGNTIGGGARKALEFSQQWDDVYLPGETDPVLLASKLRKGLYIDAAGNVLKHWKDIKTTIRDTSMNNEVVLEGNQITDAYVSSKLGRKSLKTLGAIFSIGWKNLGRMKAGIFSATPVMWDLAKRGVGMASDLIDQPIDIYVKGEQGAALIARSMRAGHYRSAANLDKVIKRPGDIDGPVLDVTTNPPSIALSKEQLSKGIVDVNGKPIRTPLQKVTDFALGPLRWLKNTAKAGFSFTLALMKKPIEAIGQFFTNWFGPDGIVFSGGKTMLERLTEIRDVLQERLPRPQKLRKGSWQDLESHKDDGKGGAGAAKSAGVDHGMMGSIGSLAGKLGSSLLEKLGLKAKDPAAQTVFQQGRDWAKTKVEEGLGGYALQKAGDHAKTGLGHVKDKLFGRFQKKAGEELAETAEGALETGVKDTAATVTKKAGEGVLTRMGRSLGRSNARGHGVFNRMKGWGGKALGAVAGTLGGAFAGPETGVYQAVRQGVSDGMADEQGGVGGLKGGLKDYLSGKVEDKITGKVEDKVKDGLLKKLANRAGGKMGKLGKLFRGGRAMSTVAEGAEGLEGAGALAAGETAAGGLAAELGAGGLVAGASGMGAGLLGGLTAAVTGIGATALGVGATALTVAGTVAATLGTAAAAVLASPVVLAAGALAIGGYGLHTLYKGVKHMWKERKMGPLSQVRMAQYGFKSDDKDHIDTLLDFEDTVAKHVTYDAQGHAKLDSKKLTFDEALEPFGVKRTDETALRNWLIWFAQRFRPVFLSHLTALRAVNKSVSIDQVDSKLKKEEKQKYLKAIEMPNGPFQIAQTPFARSGFLFMHWGAKRLEAGPKEVAAAVAAAYKVIGKETGSKKDDKKKKVAGAVAGAAVGAAAATKLGAKTEPKTGLGQALSFAGKVGKAVLMASPVGALIAGASWLKKAFSKVANDQDVKGMDFGDKLSVFLSPSLHGSIVNAKLHPLQAVRYKAYGLNDYDADHIAALKDIETHIGTRIKLSGSGEKAKAEFIGNPMDVLMHFGASFGPTNISEKSDSTASVWLEWFTRRFLPVFLTYKGSYLKLKGDSSLLDDNPADDIAAKLAPLVSAAKGQDGTAVWDIKASPWPGVRVNTDPGSVAELLAFIKKKAKVKKLTDGVTGKDKKAGDEGKGWTDLLADKTKNAWDTMKDWGAKKLDQAGSWIKKEAGKAADYVANSSVGKAVSGAYTSAKNSAVGKAVTGVAGGVGDTMKGFGASLGKAYKAVTGNPKLVKDAALAAMGAAGITNPTEMAMFMAQMDTESGGFKSLSENLNYSASTLMKLFGKKLTGGMQQAQQIASQGPQAVANFIYGNRMGNTGADDGFKYRGRGVIQLTGKDNYTKYGKMLGLDLVGNPDLAADPKVAAQIAVAYWKSRVPAAAAQAGDVAAVTKAINGGENGLSSRQQNFQKYMQQAKAGQLVASGATPDDKKQQAQIASGATGSGVGTVPGKSATAGALPTGGANATVAAATAPAASSGGASGGAGSAGGSPAPSAASIGTPNAGVAGAPSTIAKTLPTGGANPVVAAATAPTGSGDPSSSSAFGFSFNSPRSTAPSTKGIMAVQQAQHDDKMSAMGGMGDALSKSLEVQSDARDTLKSILSIVQAMQKNGGSVAGAPAQSSVAGGGANAANKPNSSLRGPTQQMPTAPVSMMNSV